MMRNRRRKQQLAVRRRRAAILRRRRAAAARKRRAAAIRLKYGRMVAARKRNYNSSLRRRFKLKLNPKRDMYKKMFLKRKFKKYPTKCDLNMELFPMYYTQVTRSTQFKIAFGSSCLPKLEVNFDLYYYKNHHVNFYHNPSTVNLNLWGNKFIIDYAKPQEIDKYDII